MTLDELRSVTVVDPLVDAQPGTDSFELDGERLEGPAAAKVFAHLDRIWRLGGREGQRPPCAVRSRNHLPTAAGLASSASGFAALTVAAAGAFGLAAPDDLEAARERLSTWARMGSGSAARSLWGGYVRQYRGEAADGHDCRAAPLHDPGHLDVRMLIVHTARGAKKVASTGGMDASRETSPYYPAWVETSEADLDAAEGALAASDVEALGAVMERSCFKMHACMLATWPPLLYWNGTTLEVIREVWEQRRAGGARGFVTSDAGPHVKVLCARAEAEALAAALGEVPGVHEVQRVAPGPAATLELVPPGSHPDPTIDPALPGATRTGA
jgi:diphosphomevalonate decarboxylase